MSPQELEWLAEQASRHSLIVEVGCFLGRSTRALADHTSGVVIATDTWSVDWAESIKGPDPIAYQTIQQHPDAFLEFLVNTRDLHNVLIRRGTLSESRLPFCPDMVFIDGDHSYWEVLRDIRAAKRIASGPGSLLCGHDYNSPHWPDVTRAVHDEFGMLEGACESIWWVTL